MKKEEIVCCKDAGMNVKGVDWYWISVLLDVARNTVAVTIEYMFQCVWFHLTEIQT